MLYSRAAGGQVTAVWVTFSTCTGRGLDTGARQAEVTKTMIRLIMEPLHTSYGFSTDLPD